jgi:hypothetical protein
MRESRGFFCDDDVSWQVRKNIARQQAKHQQRTSPVGMAAFYQENWEPDFSCSYESRIGDPGDGGKWLCDPHKLQVSAYSLYLSAILRIWHYTRDPHWLIATEQAC